jgi:hypothetical protein
MVHGCSELSRSCTGADGRAGMLARPTAATPLKPVSAAQPILLSLRYPLAKAAQKRQFGTRYAPRLTIAGPTRSAATRAPVEWSNDAYWPANLATEMPVAC